MKDAEVKQQITRVESCLQVTLEEFERLKKMIGPDEKRELEQVEEDLSNQRINKMLLKRRARLKGK